MSSRDLAISAVQFTPAREVDQQSGLLGFVSCALGDVLHLDGIAVRRTRTGVLTLSFPRGRGKYPPVRPLDDEARLVLELQILGAIDLDAGGDR